MALTRGIAVIGPISVAVNVRRSFLHYKSGWRLFSDGGREMVESPSLRLVWLKPVLCSAAVIGSSDILTLRIILVFVL